MRREMNHRGRYVGDPCASCEGRGYAECEATDAAGTMRRTERAACDSCRGAGFELSREDARSPLVRVLGDVAWRLRSAGIGDVFGAWEEIPPPVPEEPDPAFRLPPPRKRGRQGKSKTPPTNTREGD